MGGTRYEQLRDALKDADEDSAVGPEEAIRDLNLEFPDDIEDEDDD